MKIRILRTVSITIKTVLAGAVTVIIALLSVFLFTPSGTDAYAVEVGPIPLKQTVLNHELTLPLLLDVDMESTDDGYRVGVDGSLDFGEFQNQFDTLAKSVDLPNDSCASFNPRNIVAAVRSATMESRENTAVAVIHGNVKVFWCLEDLFRKDRILSVTENGQPDLHRTPADDSQRTEPTGTDAGVLAANG